VSGLPVIQTRGSGQEDVTIQSAQGANYPVFRPMSRSLLRRRFVIILKSVYRACGLVLVSVQESIPFSKRGQLVSGGQPRPAMMGTYRLKVGRCTTSVSGTVSSGFPALRQAARPPTMTNA